ncbi:hypothetical protein L6232_23270, partial [Shewanella sp. C31]|nr:hypothetical protein [Shewanella electrica]
ADAQPEPVDELFRLLALHRLLFERPKERRPLAEEEVRWLWQSLLASGAVAWAKEVAHRLLAEGKAALAPAQAALPPGEAAPRQPDHLTARGER